jgi:hypothetical protein
VRSWKEPQPGRGGGGVGCAQAPLPAGFAGQVSGDEGEFGASRVFMDAPSRAFNARSVRPPTPLRCAKTARFTLDRDALRAR